MSVWSEGTQQGTRQRLSDFNCIRSHQGELVKNANSLAPGQSVLIQPVGGGTQECAYLFYM